MFSLRQINGPHPDLPGFIACTLSPYQHIKAGVIVWIYYNLLFTFRLPGTQVLSSLLQPQHAVPSHLELRFFGRKVKTLVSISERRLPEAEPPSPGVYGFDLGRYKGRFLSAGLRWDSIFLAPLVPGSWVGAERRGPGKERLGFPRS